MFRWEIYGGYWSNRGMSLSLQQRTPDLSPRDELTICYGDELALLTMAEVQQRPFDYVRVSRYDDSQGLRHG